MNRFIAGSSPLVVFLTGIVCALLVTHSPALAAAGAARNIPVTMGDYRFEPDSIRIRPGETVRLELTNTDKLTPHNFTLKAPKAGLDIDVDVSAGKTEVVDLPALPAGKYGFHCNKKLPFMKSHRDRGMKGVLVVGPD